MRRFLLLLTALGVLYLIIALAWMGYIIVHKDLAALSRAAFI